MTEQTTATIPVNPIDEPDFPIGGPSPEATIVVEGDNKKSVAQLSSDFFLPIGYRIHGTNGPDILFGTP